MIWIKIGSSASLSKVNEKHIAFKCTADFEYKPSLCYRFSFPEFELDAYRTHSIKNLAILAELFNLRRRIEIIFWSVLAKVYTVAQLTPKLANSYKWYMHFQVTA